VRKKRNRRKKITQAINKSTQAQVTQLKAGFQTHATHATHATQALELRALRAMRALRKRKTQAIQVLALAIRIRM